MRRLIVLFVIGFLVSLTVSSCKKQDPEEEKGPLFPIVKNGKYGFINQSGKIVIKPQFHFCKNFSEGLAAVCVKRRGRYLWGYIDKTGKMVIEPQFHDSVIGSGSEFSESLACVGLDKKYGYIDKTGQMVIEPQFEQFDIPAFNVGAFSEGLACIMLNEKYGYIDRTGKIVIEPKFETYDISVRFSEGLVAAQLGKKWGYLNKTGKIAIEPQFDDARDFSEGLAAVKINDRVGFIDRTGRVVIEPKFGGWSFVTGFSEGLARVGNLFIGKTGRVVIKVDPPLRATGDFSEERALISTGSKETYKVGYIDKTGEVVIEPQFDSGGDFSGGLASVTIDHKRGYIDRMGNYVWEPAK